MRRAWLLVVIAALVMPALAGAAEEKKSEKQEKQEQELNSQTKKLSYALGMQIAQGLQESGIEVDTDILVQGMTDAMGEDETLLTAEEAQKVRQDYIKKRQAQAKKKRQAKAKKRKNEAQQFLAKNKKKEGVKTTESGLQYKVIQEGDGASPTDEDRVNADIKITEMGGETIFDSEQADQQRPLPVSGLLPGLTEGLKMMEEGAEYKLFVPPELGIQGQGKAPSRGLIIDVKLNEVLEGAAKKKRKKAPGKGNPKN